MAFEYGKPINENLSNFLLEFTTKKDIADVSASTGVSISTIDYVKRRNNTVTENNERAMIELIKVAVRNSDAKIKRAKECKRELEKILH